MRDSEEAIDKILAGLRTVETPAGMERRIMRRLEQRAAAPRKLPVAWFALGGFALAAAAVIALLAGSPRHAPEHPAAQAFVPSQPHSLPVASAPAPELAPVRQRRHASNIEDKNISAASFPAPPMPLTEQERLLLRIAHHGEPEAVPVLDPDALARQESHSEEVFEAVLASAKEPPILKFKEDIR